MVPSVVECATTVVRNYRYVSLTRLRIGRLDPKNLTLAFQEQAVMPSSNNIIRVKVCMES